MVEADIEWRPGCSIRVLRKRAWMLERIRAFFAGQGVMEVETPSLCQRVGTDPNLDFWNAGPEGDATVRAESLYLQTSPEYAMKRLLAAGSGSIYQICKAYRYGESGRFHNPEFTILEWYRVGFDLERLMDEVDALLGRSLGLSGSESERIGYRTAFDRHCGIDPFSARIADFRAFAEMKDDPGAFRLCGDDIRLWQEYLFGCYVQPHLGKSGLCFVFDYPAVQCALARLKPGDSRIAERVEVFYHGVELANGFWELDCEPEQRRRFERDLVIRRQTGKPLPAIDERLLAALQEGLPDCAGIAVGLDRVLMLLVDADSIDAVLSFSFARA